MKILPCPGSLSRVAARWLAGVALLLSACGDDNNPIDNIPTDPSLFIGTWMTTIGSFNCPGLQMLPLTGETIVVAAAADAPIQATVRDCPVKFDIAGLKGTARAPQTCRPTLSGSITIPADLAISGGSFVVAKLPGAGEQPTGVLQLTGTVMFAGITSNCEATANVTKQP